MRNWLAAGLAAITLATAATATAEEELKIKPGPQYNPFTFNFGGGASFPLADAADTFNVGWAFQFGGGYRFIEQLALQAVYFYSDYNVSEDVLPGTNVDGRESIQYGSLEAVFEPLTKTPVSFYVLGGPGIYYRWITINQITGTAVVPFCDPWLLFCSAGVVETGRVLGTRDSWNFGLDAGLGVRLKLGPSSGLFVEGRYHHLWGESFTDAQGNRRNSNQQFIPVMGGFRF